MNTNSLSSLQPGDFPHYIWRPAVLEDAAAIQRLFLAGDAADGTHRTDSISDIEREFKDPDVDVEKDSLVAFTPDGEVAALAWVYIFPTAETKLQAYFWGGVHPQHRRQGLGSAILGWMETRASQSLLARPEDLPRIMRLHCNDFEHERIAFFSRHGYETARYFYEMRRDLSQPIPAPAMNGGLRLVEWTPELDPFIFEAFNESFRDHWGFEPLTKAAWDLFMVGRESFLPAMSYAVLDGDQVAGFSINFLNPEENERKGIREAWVGDLGVRRPWRKRGIATALLHRSMLDFKAAGMDYASLGVDTENPTGALGIYERVGFTPVKRSISFQKPVERPPTTAAVA